MGCKHGCSGVWSRVRVSVRVRVRVSNKIRGPGG